MKNAELHHRYRAEIARLEAEYQHYERQWSTVPRFGWSVLVAPLAGLYFGWGAAVASFLVAVALVGVRAYLIAMRKSEIRWNLQRLIDDMGEGQHDATPGHGEYTHPLRSQTAG